MTTALLRRLRWPPGGLGLGTPLNSALFSDRDRNKFVKSVWQFILVGIATAGAIIGLDQLLFAGVSRQVIRALGAQPVLVRCAIIVFAAISEELIYRLGVSTLIAWLAALALSRVGPVQKTIAIWIGIVVAAVLFGLAHVANLPNAPHPFLRALSLNGVAGIVLGWLYWKRGLEAAIVAHLSANAFIYFGVASII
jgi:membrane protease YdiL (CAAX protease family)